MSFNTRHNHGFTLIELSIVLIIIALLAGGILTGTELLRNSQLKQVQASATHYLRAVTQFEQKHHALPGDMYNAIDIWGAQDGGDGVGNDCIHATSVSVATCNGNGDGFIADTNDTAYEAFRMWQHLANERMISGSFSGARTGTTSQWAASFGTNAPRGAKGSNIGFLLRYESANSDMYGTTLPSHHLRYAAETANAYADNPTLSAKDVWAIDRKMDDALPGQGMVVTFDQTKHAQCTTSDDPLTAQYNVSSPSDEACAIHFKADF